MSEGIQPPVLPIIWGGEPTNHAQLMGLYRRAERGEITVHLVGLEGLRKILTVFTEMSSGKDENPYHPSSGENALEAVVQRKQVDEPTLRYMGALVGEQIAHAKKEARERLRQHVSKIC
jgi:hypothetical protein